MSERNEGSAVSLANPSNEDLKRLLKDRSSEFFRALASKTRETMEFTELVALSSLRKKALKLGMAPEESGRERVRVAVLGGCSLFPLHDIFEHFLLALGVNCEIMVGEYDNYASEIMDSDSKLHEFRPNVTFLIPAERRCAYFGSLADSLEMQRGQVNRTVDELINLCTSLNEATGSEVILGNFPLPPRFDPGAYRNRTLGSAWNFRKMVNLELGLRAPAFVQICDVEFLSCRVGTLSALDEKSWFETKQPFAPNMTALVAREAAHLVSMLKKSTKKVLVLDLDNTLWGGVIGDDGLEGVELGDTSPRGEAFKSFQKYVLSLAQRGVLLAVCSKNDHDKAVEPFEKHPEMVIRMTDIVSFKANWNPKSDNIRQIASELNLGLDSFVFVDDNPAEIEIVKQFVPEVEALLLGPDPSRFMGILQDSRFFEPRSITVEDAERLEQYKQEAQRQELLASATDMKAYLESLEMKAVISEFLPVDVPRITQLINKSNQFNLTTRRRTETEVQALLHDRTSPSFTIRLSDKFGDYGLIAVVIARVEGQVLGIDTWLMSCRVLKRQVEEETVNEIVRLARLRNCALIRGAYGPTAKNGMVRGLYPEMGFRLSRERPELLEFELDPETYKQKETRISVLRRTYEST